MSSSSSTGTSASQSTSATAALPTTNVTGNAQALFPGASFTNSNLTSAFSNLAPIAGEHSGVVQSQPGAQVDAQSITDLRASVEAAPENVDEDVEMRGAEENMEGQVDADDDADS